MSAVNAEQTTLDRKPVIWLAAAFIGPLLAALLIYASADVLPLKRKNHGVLLYPDHDIKIMDRAGNRADTKQSTTRWTLLHLAAGDCKEKCREELLALEQVRRALGKQGKRTALSLLVTPYTTMHTDRLAGSVPVAVTEISPEIRAQLVKAAGESSGRAGRSRTFLADTSGRVILFYPQPVKQQALYDDLRWLLKANSGGPKASRDTGDG